MNTEERQKLIKEASQKYYSNGTSPLSDAEFDALIDEERQENPNSPLLGVGHGYDIFKTSGEKFPHKYGLVGSLDKCHDWGEYPKALKNTEVCATLKLDGLSCAMYYHNGVMYRALTRGNGEVGIDITNKIHKIVPQYFTLSDKKFTGAVRGEILMPLTNFEEYAKSNPDAKNPRNTTAGLINAKELSDDLKYLTVIVYNVIGIETTEVYPFPLYPFADYKSMNTWLRANFGVNNVVEINTTTYTQEADFMEAMFTLRTSWSARYPSDGIVITDNHINFVSSPNGAYIQYNASAFKFKAESEETEIVGIEWNLSKTKYLIPTILVQPVQLSGATVKRCAGNNAKMVKDSGWGIGAAIRMLRSGEVIPVIEETLSPKEPELPTKCPCCSTELVWEGVHLKCPNPECSDIRIQDLLVWCNSLAPIDGLGDTLKLKFFEDWHDRYDMEMSVDGLYRSNASVLSSYEVNGVQQELFRKMIVKLQSGYTPNPEPVTLVSALKALNIPRLGDATADLLSHYPDDVKKLMGGEIPDNLAYKIGNANAESIIRNKDKFKKLNYIKNNIKFTEEFQNNARIKVAITGSLNSMTRSQFEKILNANGFILGDITKDTKYLITNTPDSGSSKNAKADKLGVEKITETDFISKYNL